MPRALKIVVAALLWLITAACLGVTIVPHFIDRGAHRRGTPFLGFAETRRHRSSVWGPRLSGLPVRPV
jgi:hypothetical protein